MAPYACSRWLYRLLLRAYPDEFRDRFGGDLERDFLDLLEARGRVRAWASVITDLRQSLPSTHAHIRPARRRRRLLHPPGETLIRSLWFDLRHATRALLRAPLFTLITTATLALGIGANSAIFSLVNAVLIRPLGFAEPERLILVHEAIPERGVPRFGVSPADYLDMARIGADRHRPADWRPRSRGRESRAAIDVVRHQPARSGGRSSSSRWSSEGLRCWRAISPPGAPRGSIRSPRSGPNSS